MEDKVIEVFEYLKEQAHGTAQSKGWWSPPKTFGEQLLLFHSEISEALEEYRTGHAPEYMYYDGNLKPEGIPIELADLLIRVFDTCAHYDIDIASAILIKMEYNKSRSRRHGDKKL